MEPQPVASVVARDPPPSRSTRGAAGGPPSWILFALVFSIGAITAVVASVVVGARESEERRVDFERRAAQVAVAARISFDVPLEVLRSVPALFEASDEVTRADFRAFVGDALDRYPWIYALEWIPRVPAAARDAYEAAARADGLEGYQFKQDARAGPPVPAEERDVYYPLFYMEPPNETALGIEETALEARRVAIERAVASGETAISERLRLVQDEPSVISVIAFHPVYERGAEPETPEERRRLLRGLAAAVFRVQPVIDSALSEFDTTPFDVSIIDADAPASHSVLYRSHPQTAGDGGSNGFEHTATIGGRRWQFRVGDRADWVHGGHASWVWLGLGLLASLLAAGLATALVAVLRLRHQVTVARRLGQYTLVEKLGEGGMGAVYRAHHALLRRPTAIKLLDRERSGAVALARFEREVQFTSALTHPNTVVVYDYGHTEHGVFYYAMEYIDGVTLQDLVDTAGAQPPGRVVAILQQICGALAEAHGVGLVHRDVKPANVMLCNRGGLYDFVKVVDFGLVKEPSADDEQLSQPSLVIGTPRYMAPEMVSGRGAVDARTDLYAVGAVAYFMLTGSPVFEGRTVMELCAKHLSVAPTPPSRLADVPSDLEAVVMRCLEKKPNDRFASANDLSEALAATSVVPWRAEQARQWWLEYGDRLHAIHENPGQPQPPRPRRRPQSRPRSNPGRWSLLPRGNLPQ